MATKKSSAKKTYPAKSGKKSTTPPSKRWSAKVTTDSTKPGPGLFKKSGKAIAEGLAKKSVSPKGPGQAMQMLSFYENRGGKNLPAERKNALETAKAIAKGLAKKSVSPKGPGQAMQMLSFYENRGGKNLPHERKRVLENAKDILREKEGKKPAKKSSSKKSAAKKSTSH